MRYSGPNPSETEVVTTILKLKNRHQKVYMHTATLLLLGYTLYIIDDSYQLHIL